MMVVTLVSSLAIVTSVLSQSAKKEIEIPELFECSPMATVNYSEETIASQRQLFKNFTGIDRIELHHCRVGKLSCTYVQNGGDGESDSVSCVSTAGLFK